jgi:hypothetical protein
MVALSVMAAAPLQAQSLERITLSVGSTAENDMPFAAPSNAHALMTADLFGRWEAPLGLRLDGLVDSEAGLVTTANVVLRLARRGLTPYALTGVGVAFDAGLPLALQSGIGVEFPVRRRRLLLEGRVLNAEDTFLSFGLGVRL